MRIPVLSVNILNHAGKPETWGYRIDIDEPRLSPLCEYDVHVALAGVLEQASPLVVRQGAELRNPLETIHFRFLFPAGVDLMPYRDFRDGGISLDIHQQAIAAVLQHILAQNYQASVPRLGDYFVVDMTRLPA